MPEKATERTFFMLTKDTKKKLRIRAAEMETSLTGAAETLLAKALAE